MTLAFLKKYQRGPRASSTGNGRLSAGRDSWLSRSAAIVCVQEERQAGGKGRHHNHLQKHAKKIVDIVGGVFGKALGAVAALQKKSFARSDLAQHTLELPCLARENQRRKARELTLNLGQRRLVGIIWHLLDRLRSPARR
jgi:hypothetical protein